VAFECWKKSVNYLLELIFIRLIARFFGELYKIVYFVLMFGFYDKLHVTCYISPRSSVRNYKNLSLGRNCVINANVVVWCSMKTGNNIQINPGSCLYGHIEIGDDVMIAPNVTLAGGNHGIARNGIAMISQQSVAKGIRIENDVWIGANAVVVDGVAIGEGAVVGAGAVVTKDVERYSVVVGNPARFKSYRN